MCETPPCNGSPYPEHTPEDRIRAEWLVSWSLALAVLIEVFPTEAGLANICFNIGSLFLWLALKVTCSIIILLPLLIYVALNGRRGLHCARGRIITIGTIIIVKLVLEAPFVPSTLMGRLR